jgi:hypothetical protein
MTRIIITIIVSFLIYKLRTHEKPNTERESGGRVGGVAHKGFMKDQERRRWGHPGPKSADQDVDDGGRLGKVYLHAINELVPGEEQVLLDRRMIYE